MCKNCKCKNNGGGDAFDKAVEYVQNSYVNDSRGLPSLLLGDVAELIKIATGKEIDWKILDKFNQNK